MLKTERNHALELTDNAIKRLTYIANKAGTRYVRLDINNWWMCRL